MHSPAPDPVLPWGYRLQAELMLRTMTGEQFEEFFARVMTFRDRGFRRVRPWGNLGDRKNDGWSPLTRTLFQAYAPASVSMSSRVTVNKMRDDFEGAIDYWAEYFDTWVFVHNDFGGLGPEAEREIAALNARRDEVTCESWGPAQILREMARLSEGQLIDLLGPPVTREAFLDVSAQSLEPLFDHIQLAPLPADGQDIPRVPIDKIDRNGLSEYSQSMLLMGEARMPLVNEFVDRTSADPRYASSLAATFADQYAEASASASDPDEVLAMLMAWLTHGLTDPQTVVGACTALAYFFFTCHIFEGDSL